MTRTSRLQETGLTCSEEIKLQRFPLLVAAKGNEQGVDSSDDETHLDHEHTLLSFCHAIFNDTKLQSGGCREQSGPRPGSGFL